MTATRLHINAPSTYPLRAIRHCPTCKRRRRFSGVVAAWYGATWTCCGCGDSWGDGERLPRPFTRGWRTASKRRAKAVWDAAADMKRADFQAWLKREMDGAA